MKKISKICLLFSMIFLIISAFTFTSRLADKSSPAFCDITISAHNGSATLTITITHIGVKVRNSFVWGTVMNNPNPLNPGASIQGTVHALFNCNVDRRYRFKLKTNNVELPDYCYFPSENTFTTDTDADFGDLSTHFH